MSPAANIVSTLAVLDGIASNLNRDMNAIKDGSLGKFRGYCRGCDGPIREQEHITYAHQSMYHPEHFVCTTCTKPLSNMNFVVQGTEPMCEQCYEQTVLPACAKCTQPIKSEILHIDNLNFHSSCLTCASCFTSLVNLGVYKSNTDDPLLYLCKSCYEKQNVLVCAQCSLGILDGAGGNQKYLVVNEFKYHVDCFACYECHIKLQDNQAYALNNKFYCKDHIPKDDSSTTS